MKYERTAERPAGRRAHKRPLEAAVAAAGGGTEIAAPG